MSLGELLVHGGWPMVPIYLCSIIALGVFTKKCLEFRALKIRDISWLQGVLQALEERDLEAARAGAGDTVHPAGEVVVSMLEVRERRPDRVESEAARVGSLAVQSLEKHVGGLSFIAQAAPLLGLLGTVIGMVELFMSLQGTGMATVDVALLASGIWTALLTTAAGLMVAVPTLAAYTYLNSRTDRFRLLLRDAVEQVLTALPEPEPTDGERRTHPRLVHEAADAV